MSGGGEIIIRNGEFKKWWDTWIRYYDVILIGTEAEPKLKIRAWRLLALPVVLALVLGLAAGLAL